MPAARLFSRCPGVPRPRISASDWSSQREPVFPGAARGVRRRRGSARGRRRPRPPSSTLRGPAAGGARRRGGPPAAARRPARRGGASRPSRAAARKFHLACSNSMWAGDVLVAIGEGHHGAEPEGGVGHLVERGRPRRQDAVLDAEVGDAVRDPVATPVPAPDRAGVEPQRRQVGGLAAAEGVERVGDLDVGKERARTVRCPPGRARGPSSGSIGRRR